MTQTVVITGASAGIGRATARLFGRRGASVALVARGSTGLDATAREVEEGGVKALPVPADVADPSAADAAAEQAESQIGPIDLWVNVAFTSPQFSWVRTRLSRHPQPVPPIYQPEVAAAGVVYAADHPGRKQYWVGGTTAATMAAQKVAAPLLDRYLARTGYDSQQTGEQVSADRPDNLWQPLDGPDGADHGAHGIFDSRSHARSFQLWASQHLAPAGGALAAAAILGGALASRAPRRR